MKARPTGPVLLSGLSCLSPISRVPSFSLSALQSTPACAKRAHSRLRFALLLPSPLFFFHFGTRRQLSLATGDFLNGCRAVDIHSGIHIKINTRVFISCSRASRAVCPSSAIKGTTETVRPFARALRQCTLTGAVNNSPLGVLHFSHAPESRNRQFLLPHALSLVFSRPHHLSLCLSALVTDTNRDALTPPGTSRFLRSAFSRDPSFSSYNPSPTCSRETSEYAYTHIYLNIHVCTHVSE